MSFNVKDIIKQYAYNEEKSSYLGSFRVVDVLYHKRNGLVIIKAENGCVLPHSIYLDVLEYFKAMGFDKTKLYIKATDQNLPIREINLYLEEYRKENNGFTGCVPIVSENGFDLSYTDEASYQSDLNELDELKLFFYDLGYRNEINLCYKKPEEPVIIEKEALPQVPRVQKQFNGNSFNGNNFNGGFQNKGEQHSQERPQYFRKTKEYTELKIDDLVDTMYNVKFTGQMFKIDERTTRTGAIIQTVYVKDDSNAVVVKFVESKRFPKEVLKENKEGRYAVFYGYYHLDTFSNDYIFEPDHIEFIEVDDSLHDNEPEKRVELHMHTKLSEMDGVSSPTEVVKAAYSMGHRAVAITDHLCLQGFHEAQMTYKGIMKSAGENKPDFKVLYGCEMNMVSPTLNIVYNATDDSLNDVEYVVFDLETTGLSTRYDYIIEFGAVVMRRGTVVEEKDFFIKPKIDLSLNIKNLTHITEENLKDARPFEECKDEILDFIKGRVLVAHNASFDFGFLNSEFERIGMPKLTNPVIDTLDLSRSLLKNRRAYRLGNMCRAYNIPYDEDVAHRANYDADVLAQVFNFMLKDLAKAGVNTLNDLKNFQDEEAFVKNRAFHTTVLCKNKAGLKDLFKLISISNTKTLAVFGKANTKDTSSEFIAEPRIFKETIEEYRENLLIGSACLNGEVFEIASTRSKEELAKAISFYDYIEVQPLENYRFLYEDRQLFDKERLKQYLRDIIDEALRQNKIVVATGDVHYVRKDEKILRDVYISAQAIGGAHHPLYIFDKEKRAKQITPDQRFLNTREMLDAFKWLGDEKLVHDMVITNTNKIADLCDNIKPFTDELKPPKIDDAIAVARRCNIIEEPFTERHDVISADQYLREFVYYNAHKLYG
ncbi:MAG: exonuclease domain-containing protein, partial [Erysipelotrichaceae bacterium]|nr:exonuclease domain-containing protein [Erysipelotrichaceae bacterium]